MTTSSNLQCPHCSRPIAPSKVTLIESGAKVNCNHCQQSIMADNDAIPAESILDTDILIHDDMEIDDSVDPITEYDSLEGMNAWVARSNVTPSTSINRLINNNATDAYSIDNQPDNTKILADMREDNSVAISSTEANSIHASIANNTSDAVHENTWLEALLQEQNNKVDSVANDYQSIELEQQLIDIKVPTANAYANSQAHINKTQAHLQSSVVTTPQPISTLLWSVGSGLLILFLMMQYIIFNIDSLAKNPAVGSSLQAACSVMHCKMPSADINAFVITKPTVKASQVKNSRTFSDIQAQLINESGKTQLLPNLKVSIYNEDTIIGEFIAQPSDYLLSSETKLAAERHKSVMFTVPITIKKVTKVMIEPLY